MSVLMKSMLGVECICLKDVRELKKRSKDVLGAQAAILDINLGPNVLDGVDAFNWLMSHGFEGKVLFLTGHARTNPQVDLAQKTGTEVLEKPVHPDQLISFVRRAISKAA